MNMNGCEPPILGHRSNGMVGLVYTSGGQPFYHRGPGENEVVVFDSDRTHNSNKGTYNIHQYYFFILWSLAPA